MTAEALEARMEKLEERLQQVEVEIHTNKNVILPQKRGWRAFVGVDADNSDFAVGMEGNLGGACCSDRNVAQVRRGACEKR